MPTPTLPHSRRLFLTIGIVAAAACRSEGGSDSAAETVAADSAAAAPARAADSTAPRSNTPARDAATSATPAGPAGMYVGGPRTGQEMTVTLQPNGQYVALVRTTARGTMSYGRYEVTGDSLVMLPDKSLAGPRRMVAVLRGDSLTVNPDKKPVLLRRRRALVGDSGVASPFSPR